MTKTMTAKTMMLLSLLLLGITSEAQVKKDNLIKVTCNTEDAELLREVHQHLIGQGWSVKDANMDFLYINTMPRNMTKYNTEMSLQISVSNRWVYVRGQWFTGMMRKEGGARVEYATSNTNVQKEMWQLMMNLVNALNSETIEFFRE